MPESSAEDSRPAPASFIGRPIGPFQTSHLMGEGGMGAVFEARNRRTGESVALKVLSAAPSLSEMVRKRFKREWMVASKLDHPHIVRHLEFGEDDGQMYLALELLRGGDGEDRLESCGGWLPETSALTIGRDIALALTAVHAQGFVHRDIKPGNIFFDGAGSAKLGDFGCARDKSSEDPITVDGMILGTPDFMSPEQARGENSIDEAADIYGLGATLYYLATGRTPFGGSTVWGIIGQVINHPFPDPRTVNGGISDGLAEIILYACAKSRLDRYPSAQALADDCNRLLLGQSLSLPSKPSAAVTAIMPAIQLQERSSILLIDDDPIISRIYCKRLRDDGFEVGVAATGESAMHAVSVSAPDLILLDLHLPDMDGIEVLKRLRAIPDPRIPVIILSNAFNLERMSAATAAGADAVLAKSRVSPRQVSAAVRDVLSHGRLSMTFAAGVMCDDVSATQLAELARFPLQRLTAAVERIGSTGRTPCPFMLEIQDTCRGLSAMAAAAGAREAAALSSATEMLARHLVYRPGDFQDSTRRTLQEAIEALRNHLSKGTSVIQPSTPARHALVVDDDPVITRLASTALKLLGLEATITNDPLQARELATSTRFDIFILDINMPGVTGVELATAIRRDLINGDAPIIFITSLTEMEASVGPIGGAVDLIGKPFPIMELATKALIMLGSSASTIAS